MTLLYIDGYDHYTNSTTGTTNLITELAPELYGFTKGYDNGLATHAKLGTMPELGGRGLQVAWKDGDNINSAGSYVWLKTPVNWTVGNTFGVGFYFYMDALPINSLKGGIISYGLATGGSATRSIRASTSGELQFWSGVVGTSGSSLADTGFFVTAGVLYHAELKITLHATTGSAELRINGATAWSSGSISTYGGSNVSHLLFGLGTTANSIGQQDQADLIHYKSLFTWDTNGSLNNDFLGERNISTIMVDADLAPQDWTLSSGTDAFALIDDTPPVSLTNFITGENDLDESRFAPGDLPPVDLNITAIQITPQAYKTGTTNTNLTTGIDINASEDVSEISLTQDQPLYFSKIIEVSPDSGLPLTTSDFNNMEIIVRRTDS